MIGNLLRLPEDYLQQVIDDPDLINALIFPNDGTQPPEGQHLEIHTVWHILHFLLTGSEWDGEGATAKVILGGTPLCDDDIGYRPAQYLSAAEVQEVANTLNAISAEQLWDGLDEQSMHDVHLYAYDSKAKGALRTPALSAFDRIKAFYHQAAANGHAVIKYLS